MPKFDFEIVRSTESGCPHFTLGNEETKFRENSPNPLPHHATPHHFQNLTVRVAVNAYAMAEFFSKLPVYTIDCDGRGKYRKEFSGVSPKIGCERMN